MGKPARVVVQIPLSVYESMTTVRPNTVMVTMPLKPEDEKMWRNVFEHRIRIVDWHMEAGGLVMTGSPMVGVQGINAIGAVECQLWIGYRGFITLARRSGAISLVYSHIITSIITIGVIGFLLDRLMGLAEKRFKSA